MSGIIDRGVTGLSQGMWVCLEGEETVKETESEEQQVGTRGKCSGILIRVIISNSCYL